MDDGQRFGRYILTHELGRGGMATVYRAVRAGPMGFSKDVAIKRINEGVTLEQIQIKSLINEARIGGQLKHPNIVEIYEFDQVGETYYLAMEFVRGWTCEQLLQNCRLQGLCLPLQVALDIIVQVCAGLDYAHTFCSEDGKPFNLVHRDIKPANLMVTPKGVVKIMDFGIAKSTTNLFKTTQEDTAKGTPQYMSPEQVDDPKLVAAPSDIFSTGAILYELCTSERLYPSGNLPSLIFAVVQAKVGQQAQALENLLPGLGRVFGRACAKDIAQRYPSAREFAHDLRPLLAQLPAGPLTADFIATLHNQPVSPGAATVIQGLSDGVPVSQSTLHVAQTRPNPATALGGPPQGPALGAPPPQPQARPATNPALEAALDAFPDASAVPQTLGEGVELPGCDTLDSLFPDELDAFPNPQTLPSLLGDDEEEGSWSSFDSQDALRAWQRSKSPPFRRPLLLLLLLATVSLAALIHRDPTLLDPLLTRLDEATHSSESKAVAQQNQRPPDGVKAPPEAPDTGVGPRAPKAKKKGSPSQASAPPSRREAAAPKAPEEPPVKVIELQPLGPGTRASAGNRTTAPKAAKTAGGKLSVRPSTPDGRILIDGHDTGRSSLAAFPVQAGTHTLLVRSNSLGRSTTRTVTIKTGQTTVLPGYNFYTEQWKE